MQNEMEKSDIKQYQRFLCDKVLVLVSMYIILRKKSLDTTCFEKIVGVASKLVSPNDGLAYSPNSYQISVS